MRKQKMGDSQANNSKKAKDEAKMTVGVNSLMTVVSSRKSW